LDKDYAAEDYVAPESFVQPTPETEKEVSDD
jgi:hypothetical protein